MSLVAITECHIHNHSILPVQQFGAAQCQAASRPIVEVYLITA